MWFAHADQLWKFYHGLYSTFLRNFRSQTGYYNLVRVLNCACLLFSACLYDAMNLVWESKFKLELLYRLLSSLSVINYFIGPNGLKTCLKAVWSYVYHNGLMHFKCWSCFHFLLGLLASFLHAWLIRLIIVWQATESWVSAHHPTKEYSSTTVPQALLF